MGKQHEKLYKLMPQICTNCIFRIDYTEEDRKEDSHNLIYFCELRMSNFSRELDFDVIKRDGCR